jgi:hypothetical protein
MLLLDQDRTADPIAAVEAAALKLDLAETGIAIPELLEQAAA